MAEYKLIGTLAFVGDHYLHRRDARFGDFCHHSTRPYELMRSVCSWFHLCFDFENSFHYPTDGMSLFLVWHRSLLQKH